MDQELWATRSLHLVLVREDDQNHLQNAQKCEHSTETRKQNSCVGHDQAADLSVAQLEEP